MNGAKVLDLATVAATWGSLDDEVARHLGGYGVEVSLDRVPDQPVEGACVLLSVFAGMLLPSERDHRDAVWDAGRLSAGETRNAEHGRRPARSSVTTPRPRTRPRTPP